MNYFERRKLIESVRDDIDEFTEMEIRPDEATLDKWSAKLTRVIEILNEETIATAVAGIVRNELTPESQRESQTEE